MNRISRSLIAVAAALAMIGVLASTSTARDDNLDGAFLTALGTGFNADVNDVLVQPDGKVVAIGNFTDVNGVPRSGIARLHADGRLDTSFDPGAGTIGGQALALARQSSGKLIVVGKFTSYDGTSVNRIVRINSDGSIDNTFVPTAGGFANPVLDVAVDSSDRIVVVGNFIALNDGSTEVKGVARFDPDGTLDASFKAATGSAFPYPLSMPAKSVAIADDRIVMGGDFTEFDGVAVDYVVQLSSTGAIDNTFAANLGSNLDAQALRVAYEADKQIIVSGEFNNYGATPAVKLVRLNSDGTHDAAFSTNAGFTNCCTNSVAVMPDGKILLGGSFTQVAGGNRQRIARLEADGRLDTGFAIAGTGPNGFVNAVAISGDSVYFAGTFDEVSGTPAGRIARLVSDAPDPGPSTATPTPTQPTQSPSPAPQPSVDPVALPLKVSARKVTKGIPRKGSTILVRKASTSSAGTMKFVVRGTPRSAVKSTINRRSGRVVVKARKAALKKVKVTVVAMPVDSAMHTSTVWKRTWKAAR
jgi:uncharacterized delta-60 repeat protein